MTIIDLYICKINFPLVLLVDQYLIFVTCVSFYCLILFNTVFLSSPVFALFSYFKFRFSFSFLFFWIFLHSKIRELKRMNKQSFGHLHDVNSIVLLAKNYTWFRKSKSNFWSVYLSEITIRIIYRLDAAESVER